MSTEIEDKVRKAAILNAAKHEGRANPKAVLGNLLGDNVELRKQAKDLMPLIQRIVQETNTKPFEELMTLARQNWPEEFRKEEAEERRLPPLPNADKYSTIVTRLAPNPDFVLHIGNARAAVLSHDYAKMYKGKFIVRFEDTDPRLKKAQLQYYDLIREDLRWLGCGWDEEYIQSDRMSTYYEIGRNLLTRGGAYVCECQPERFRELVNTNRPCPDRNLKIDQQQERWEKMLRGDYGEGKAVYRVKTDLAHPNPAVRDWPAFRVIDTTKYSHPRVGSRYRVWPLYNLASGVDDHELGITHVIRGKEHLTNMARQLYLYEHLGWKYPDAVHYGRLKVEGLTLSKSKLMKGLETGEYSGVDDPRLGTLAALRRRGYLAETIRKLMWDIGPKPVDVTISWDNINAQNRKLIDPTSHRYFFTPNPIKTKVSGVPKAYDLHLPLHPQHPEMGTRNLAVEPSNGEYALYLAGSDKMLLSSERAVRLMSLFNIKAKLLNGEATGQFLSEGAANVDEAPIVQWVPSRENVPVEVVLPDATTQAGLAETGLKAEHVGSILQFVRYGFGRIDKVSSEKIIVYFAHQ
jgi:glutamyl-tRNA synthetase